MNKRQIVEIARENEAFMDGTTTPVQRIISDHDVVFACWHDPSAEDGVSTLILKGQRKLAAMASETTNSPARTSHLRRGAQHLRFSAVTVLSLEMALAARETLGEAEGDEV